MTPPVKIRTHSPGSIVAPLGLPANDSPTRTRVVSRSGDRSAKRTAYPSIAELSSLGTGNGDTMSTARTRPSDCLTWTRSVAVTGSRNVRISARARSTGMEFGS